jgi:hypothetical protein
MAAIDFDEVFNALVQGVTGIAQTAIQGHKDEAESDGQSMLNQMRANLQTWTQQFTTNQISQSELGDLIDGQKDVLEMAALTKAGVKEADLDSFKSAVISLIKNTFFALI